MNYSASLILASGSPRRAQMLTQSRVSFKIIVPDIHEAPAQDETGSDYVLRNAREKALAVANQVNTPSLILSADTIVLSKAGAILEKPRDAVHAKTMLQQLSGDYHYVLTGYALFRANSEIISRIIKTKVTFRVLSEHLIDAYIQTKEGFDKAGGYGIQGAAMGFVVCIEGSYTNVMGLPLAQVLADLDIIDSNPSNASPE